MVTEVTATSLFAGPDRGTIHNVVLRHDAGLITEITPGSAPTPAPRTFILPAFVNAHDHARPTASSFGAVDMPLESWILRSAMGTPPDPYLAAAAAMARSARAGCAAMMIHYTRPSGKLPLIEEAKEIARAANDVGIRIAFALAVRDQNPVVYGDSEPVLSALSAADRSSIEQLFVRPAMSLDYIELTEAIAAEISGPKIDVQFGPAGVQWCSRPLLEAIAENSARTGRRVHMHLLETVYQRAWADRHFPDGVVRHLRDIGLLSPRLTLAHGIHARPDELEMIAASGARLVTNFSSNLHLHSGLAPIAAAHRCGCAIAVGVDGLALDEDDDVIREMRLVQLAHGGLGFARTWTRPEFFSLVIRNGRAATGAPGPGELAPGAAADFVVLDLDRLDRDRIMEVDPLQLLFARGNAALVRDVVVGGQTIVREGKVVGVDLPAIERELRGMYREGVKQFGGLARAWGPLEGALSRWFEGHMGCG
ncbi:MAG: amidohydrolase family protein [Bradyrhizobium sp.]|nr:amidohydrolase family protein [Bradyrhizobium sp.]